MRHIRLIGLGPVCALLLLLSSIASPGHCSLAAYSETRSFRDALEGRSMEEAISGPVDKDTSSYGDRTSSGSMLAGSSSGMQGSNGGSGSMMLTIPANGNLNNNMMSPAIGQQQSIDEQSKSANGGGSEIEREAGPINGASDMPMDTQQQMMEQKSARQMQRNGNSVSRTNSRLSSPKNARLQQQSDSESYGGGAKAAGGETGFGEEQSSKQPMDSSYGGKQATNGARNDMQKPMNGGAYGSDDTQQQGQEQQAVQSDQQQMMNGGAEQQQQQEKSYANGAGDEQQQMAAKQRAMAAMLMSMNSGMKYSRGSSMMSANGNGNGYGNGNGNGNGNAGSGYGDKKPSAMAQSMMMSLANKAAYMNQKDQSQRQMAPQMNGMSMSAGGYNKMAQMGASSGAGASGQYSNGASSPMASAMLMMNGANGNGMRGMRRAKQRKMEKKMSPAMMNAMLNQMMSMKQRQQQSEMMSNGYMKPTSMSMPMKSQANAEMMANAMMPRMADAMAGMSAPMREQYKRMMVSAIMQQQQQQSDSMDNGYGADQEQEQQQQAMSGDAYGEQKPSMMNGPAKTGSPGSGYSAMTSSTTSTMSPMAMVMSMMNGNSAKQAGDYEGQQMMTPGAASFGNYAERQPKRNGMKMAGAGAGGDYEKEQEQQKDSTEAGYGDQQQQREMMNGNSGATKGMSMNSMAPMVMTNRPMAMPMANGYGSPMVAAPMMMAMMMKQQQMMNGANGKLYGGESMGMDMEQKRQNGAAYGETEQQQQQQKQEMIPTTMMPTSMGIKSPMAGTGNSDQGYSNGGANGMAMGQMQEQMPMLPVPMNGKMPMNGFRQAYSQMRDNKPSMGMGTMNSQMGNNGASNYGPASSGAGTKTSQMPANDYASGSSPMARPMGAQKGYEQQQNMEQVQQQQQQDEYGAAPMGQAEPFAFDYKIEDDYGNGQYRKEESDKDGVVRGSYGYTDVSGIYRHVEYVADENGFRANIKSNEPGLSSEGKTAGAGAASASASAAPANASNGSPASGSSSSQMMEGVSGGAGAAMQAADMRQQQQMIMMTPVQTQLNENGEK